MHLGIVLLGIEPTSIFFFFLSSLPETLSAKTG